MRVEQGNIVTFIPTQIAAAETIRLERFVELFRQGVEGAVAAGKLTESPPLSPNSNEPDAAATALMSEAMDPPRLARREVDNGFQYLYGLAVVKLCSIMETAVNDFLVALLTSWPACREESAVRKIKGSLVEFATLDAEQQAVKLSELLAAELNSTFKPGVGKFECLLDAAGFGGPVDDAVKRNILELIESRNVMVHRAGKADPKFLERCPWLGLKVGDEVKVLHTQYQKYTLSCQWYLLELNRRWCEVSGEKKMPNGVQLQEQVLKLIKLQDRHPSSLPGSVEK